ncbi:NACHT, LRR and PYD domains-containing protein 12-like [Pleurodeles waltl]|uniref:NACHT, LRR and PYD domains-containing protein 12-like n=1 Tax=Pleurodeles waltl TaxID=8319 RepID=UPI003709C074
MARNQGRTLSETDIQEFQSKLSKYSESELRRLSQYFQPDIVYVIENIDLYIVLNELCFRKAIFAEEAQIYKTLAKQTDSSTAASLLVADVFDQNGDTVLKMWVSLFALQRIYSHPNLLGMLDEIIENGYNVLQEELLNEYGHHLPPDLKDCQQLLKDRLFNMTNNLKEYAAPGQSQGPQSFPISERYVELVVISERSFRKQVLHEALEAGELHEYHLRQKVQTGLERITPNRLFRWCFRSHRMPQSVLVTGVPGVGKTTLMQKFIFEWVNGKHYQKFAFIFFFKFRELKQNDKDTQTSLELLILQEYPFLREKLGMILEDPQKLLFIFDGLDESRCEVDLSSRGFQDLCVRPTQVKTTSSIVASLVKQTLVKGCCVLLTSRPFALQKVETGILHRSAEIVGFLSKEREGYFTKFYNNDAISSKVFQYVRDTGILYTLCYNPSYCWITCTALKPCFTKQAEKPLAPPKTVTQLFVSYISNILKNHTTESSCVATNFKGIGWLADHGVRNRIFVFYNDDLSAFEVRPSMLLSGFMMESIQMDGKSEVTRSFLHLTIQEFWAAMVYYLDYTKERFKELIQTVTDCEDGRYEILLRFLAGLSHPPSRSQLETFLGRQFSAEATREVIKWLGEKVHQELESLKINKDKRKLMNMFCFLFESRNSSLVRDRVGQGTSLDFSEYYLTPVDCTILSYILGCCKETENLNLDSCFIQTEGLEKLTPVLYSIKELRLNRNDLKDAGIDAICQALKSPQCRIQSLGLQSNILTGDCCEKLASAIVENKSLVDLDLAKNKIRDHGLSILLSVFDGPHCIIHTLSLQENGLSNQSCQTLLKISDSGSLKTLDLRGNLFTDECAGDMQYLILTCTSLTEIRLGMNDFTPKTEEHLQSLGADRPGLDIRMG